jgi:hypothetical protein
MTENLTFGSIHLSLTCILFIQQLFVQTTDLTPARYNAGLSIRFTSDVAFGPTKLKKKRFPQARSVLYTSIQDGDEINMSSPTGSI